MPLQTRIVEPLYVTRNTVWLATNSPDNNELSYGATGSIPNEMEAVINGTCANIIRQLSSLSKHAEDMFGELARESNSLVARVNLLKIKFNRLSAGVGRLDGSDEGGVSSLIKTKKVFKSTVVFDQEIFSRNSMPASMREMYSRCDEPPPLYKLNPFRDDGMDCMRFYADTNLFFELRKSNTLKASEKILDDREKKVIRRSKLQLLEDYSGSHNKHAIKQINNNIKELQRQLSTQRGKFITPKDDSHYDIANCQVKLIESRQFSHCVPQLNNHQAGNSMLNRHITENSSTDIILSNDYATPFGTYLMCDKSNEYNYCETQSSNNYQYAIGTNPTTEVLNPLGTPSCKVRPLAPQRFDSLKRPPSSAKTQALASHRYSFNHTTLSPSLSQIEDDLYFMKYLPPPPPSRTPHVSISPSLPSENIPPPPPLPPMTDQLAIFANNEVNSHSKQKISSIVQSNPADTNINNTTFRNTTGINHTAHYSTHADFFKMIKDGVVLRKETNKEKEINTVSDNVTSILARRLAVEISDSDSSSNKDDESNSWTDDDEETHCLPTIFSNNILTNDLSLDSNHATLHPPPPSLIENNLLFTEPFLPLPQSPPLSLIENDLDFTEPFPSPPPSSPLVSINPPSPLETGPPSPPLPLDE